MNHRYGFFSFLLAALVFFFAALPVTRAAEDKIHVVAKGETIFSISHKYGVSQEELMKYNGISDPGKLRADQRLRIPQAAPGVSAPASTRTQAGAGSSGYETYRVVKNDTLFGLAKKYGISVPELQALNGFSAAHVIKVGETIKVPAKAGTGNGVAAVKPDAGAGAHANAARKPDASLRWPIRSGEIVYMTGKLYGVAIVGERGEAVKSLTHGTVISAGPYRGFGKGVIVEVAGGYLYVYGGCESLSVKEGDRVGPGMEVGKLGIDALSGKNRLFFIVYQGNKPIDPAKAPRA